MRAEELKGHLDAVLLATLEGGPRHGYAVIEALRQSTDGRLDLPTGTIYPALRRLEQAGLITGTWSVVGGRRRREYRLTPAGIRALSGRRAAWRDFSATVTAALESATLVTQLGGHGMAMSEPRLIRSYLQVLAAQLPASIVEELADGLTETHRSYLQGSSCRRGGRGGGGGVRLGGGDPGRLRPREPGPAGRPPAARAGAAGRRLLGGGAGDQPGLARTRAGPGGAGPWLVACIGLLFVAALGRRYRIAVYSGIAGCAGFAALDASLIVGTLVVAGRASGLTALAIAVSSARIALCARAAVASQQNT